MTADDPTPRMHEDEVTVDDDTVRALLGDQFPHWADRRLRRMADSGTDNAIYRLGVDLGIRLPRIHWAEGQIDKECRWLPELAADLPTGVPVPVGRGHAGHGYPFPWLVYRWLEGTSLDRAVVDDWDGIAEGVAEFVLALEQHFWQCALEAGDWTGAPVWIHADLLPGNILISRGRLSGIIDWSGAGVGDPACEAMVAWSLPPRARRLFRRTLGFDDATWARARAWVVEQTVFYIPYYAGSLPHAVDQARARLDEALRAD